MEMCYDQRREECYAKFYSQNNDLNDEMPYRSLFLKSTESNLEKFVITDDICDDENFEDERRENNSSVYSKN